MVKRVVKLTIYLVTTIFCGFTASLLYILATGKGFNTLAVYPDFVATDLARSGFDKRLELRAMQVFLGTTLLLAPFGCWALEKRFGRYMDAVSEGLCNAIVSFPAEVVRFVKELKTRLLDGDMDAHIAVMSCVYLVAMGLFYKKDSYFAYLLVNLAVLYNLRAKIGAYVQVIISGLIFYYALHGMLALVDWLYPFLPAVDSPLVNQMLKCLAVAYLVTISHLVGTEKLKNLSRMTGLAQIPLPLLLIRAADWKYSYHGELVQLFDTKLFGMTVLLFVIAAISYNLITFFRRREHTVFATTAICLAVYFAFYLPNPCFLRDMFHNGDFIVPLQQFLEFGKIPYVDYMPIHGFCDFIFAATARIFLDGTYASLNAGITISNMVMALILSTVFYHAVQNKYYCVLASIIGLVNLRYFILAATLTILVDMLQRKNFPLFLTAYLWSCLFNLLWYPALGVCFAFGMAPMAVYSFRKRIPRLSRGALLCMGALAMLFAVAFLMKDILWGIFLFILKTTPLSVETQGTALLFDIRALFQKTDFSRAIIHILCAFSSIPAALGLFIAGFRIRGNRGDSFLLYIAVSCAMLILFLTNYTFLRAGLGWRVMSLNHLLFLVFIPLLFGFFSRVQRIVAMYGIMAFAVFASFDFSSSPAFLSNIRYGAPAEISEYIPVIEGGWVKRYDFSAKNSAYVLPGRDEMSEIGNLGKIFIPRVDLDSLLKTRQYIRRISNNDTFLSLSGNISLYAIFNMDCPTKYSTKMHMEGEWKQKSVIQDVIAKKVNVCLVDLYYYDPRFQTYRVYVHLLRHGYRFTKQIGDSIFLVKAPQGETAVLTKEVVAGYFEQLGMPPVRNGYDIGSLPAVWRGTSKFVAPVDLEHVTEYADIKKENGLLRCAGENPAITLKFKKAINPFAADFILVSFETTDGKRLSLILNFREQGEDYSDKSKIKFYAGAKDNRVPTLTNPYWLYARDIDEIRIVPQKMKVGDAFTCDVSFEVLKE